MSSREPEARATPVVQTSNWWGISDGRPRLPNEHGEGGVARRGAGARQGNDE
jgi:hypothetical protein